MYSDYIGYVLQSPECLKLPSMIANVIWVIAAAIITISLIKSFAKHFKIHTTNINFIFLMY